MVGFSRKLPKVCSGGAKPNYQYEECYWLCFHVCDLYRVKLVVQDYFWEIYPADVGSFQNFSSDWVCSWQTYQTPQEKNYGSVSLWVQGFVSHFQNGITEESSDITVNRTVRLGDYINTSNWAISQTRNEICLRFRGVPPAAQFLVTNGGS